MAVDGCRMVGGAYCLITGLIFLGFLAYTSVSVHSAIVHGVTDHGTKLEKSADTLKGDTLGKAGEYSWYRHDPFDTAFSLNMPTGHTYKTELCAENKDTSKLKVVWTNYWGAAETNMEANLRTLEFTEGCASFDNSKQTTLTNNTIICPSLSSFYIGVGNADGVDTKVAYDFTAKFTEEEADEDSLCTGVWEWVGKIFLWVFIGFIACGAVCVLAGVCCCVGAVRKRRQYEYV